MSTFVRSTQRVVSAAVASIAVAMIAAVSTVVRLMRAFSFGSLRVQHVLAAPLRRRRLHQVLAAPRQHLTGGPVVGIGLQRGREVLTRLVEAACAIGCEP